MENIIIFRYKLLLHTSIRNNGLKSLRFHFFVVILTALTEQQQQQCNATNHLYGKKEFH